ncbi:MAG TPA: hypothetical protein VLJ60_12100, partial [bacterium]|nr:hypothetical protein [bacterium]
MRMPFVAVFIISLIYSGCSDFRDSRLGTEGEPCFGNGTCKKGLQCVSGICTENTDTNFDKDYLSDDLSNDLSDEVLTESEVLTDSEATDNESEIFETEYETTDTESESLTDADDTDIDDADTDDSVNTP